MRTLLTVSMLLLFPATAAAAPTCSELASAIHTMDPAFPQVSQGTEQQLATWRASCAEEPPTGEGDVVLLCQADTSENPVFFWLKATRTAQTLGFASCP